MRARGSICVYVCNAFKVFHMSPTCMFTDYLYDIRLEIKNLKIPYLRKEEL